MKNKKWLRHPKEHREQGKWLLCLISALLSFLFSVCGIGQLVTGWDLPDISLGNLIICCGIFSLILSLCLYFKCGRYAVPIASVLFIFILYKETMLWEQLRSFAYAISMHYRRIHGLPVIGSFTTSGREVVLLLLGYLTAMSVSYCLCCRKSILFALPIILLPTSLCLVTASTVPDALYLFLLILGMAILLITDWVRKKQPKQFAALTLRAFVASALALALLFVANPPAAYVNRAPFFQEKAMTIYEKITYAAKKYISTSISGSYEFRTLNLHNVGPKSNFTYTVMQVTASYDGNIYLRGRDYDVYTGISWESSEGRNETFPVGTETVGELTVATSGAKDIIYIPYYSRYGVTVTNGVVKNRNNAKEYSFSVAKRPISAIYNVDKYTSLPSETYEWAKPLADEIIKEKAGEKSNAELICDYVRNTAPYNSATSAMDMEYGDFAKWFLEESDTGYCVHYATAATVLLRAAGIPARYIEGYMVPCKADVETVVTNQNAHSWVEYYDYATHSWTVLEATPPSSNSQGTVTPDPPTTDLRPPTLETRPPQETEAPEQQDPPETAPNTEPPQLPEDSEQPPEDTEVPGGIGGGEGNGQGGAPKGKFVLPKSVTVLLWIIAAAIVIPVQGEFRIAVKEGNRNKGTPNKKALARWKQLVYFSRLTKTKLPEKAEALALKAKFSQHTLTDAELDLFDRYIREILTAVNKMPFYKKYLLRWVFAVG